MEKSRANGWSSPATLALRGLCALLGVMPVASLLAWIYRLGSFSDWFWRGSVPAMAALVAIALVCTITGRQAQVRNALVVGTIGGVVGTLAYDFVRAPEVMFGLRPFIPVQSYGLLMLDTRASSPATEFAGWLYNLSNGTGFGITYAVVALRRRWYWALVWAAMLESSTVVSPFAQMYLLAGKWVLIALAYAAHVAYAIPLGKIVEAAERFTEPVQGLPLAPVSIAVVVLGLAVWQQPWAPGPTNRASAAIVRGRFQPQWLRVPVGGCAVVRDGDTVAYPLAGAEGASSVTPGQSVSVCASTPGVVRVRTSNVPDAGGILLVDPEMGK